MKEEDQREALIWSFRVLNLAEIPNQKDYSYEKLEQELAQYLDRLIVEDFSGLVSILYRIDIPQEKATAALAAKEAEETAGEVMAQLIIERQLQKIETRKKYSQR